MKGNKFTAYLFEVAWILPSITIPVAFMVAITLTAFAVGIGVPGKGGTIDPKAVSQTAPFDSPGLKELAPGKYEAVIIAQIFQFTPISNTPDPIRVPVGSEVTFVVTSQDVIHGFKISDTPINVMVIPGQISRVSTKFTRPGEYLVLCHEYCGGGHQAMFAKIIVE